MGNIPLIMIASPGVHKDFVKKVNGWKYTINGRKFKGKQAPYVSEIKFYDIRIPKEIEEDFVTDLGIGDLFAARFGTTHHPAFTIVQKFLSLIRFFTPFHQLPSNHTKPRQHSLGWWAYCWSPGVLRRKPDKLKINDREVL